MDHPTPAILRGFLQQTLSQDEVRAVVAHLLPGCAHCSAEIASLRNTLYRQRTLAKDLPTIWPSYGAALERASAATLDQASSLRANRRYDFLEDDEVKLPAQAHKLVTLYKDLLRQSWSLRHKDPAKMLQLARRATIVANALSSRRYGGKRVADWQCRAWAELGNAYRVVDNHMAAEEAFKHANEIFALGTQREILLARILDLMASLSARREQFEQAYSELELAYKLYLHSEDHHLAGRILVRQAVYISYKGDLIKSLQLIHRSLGWIDRRREPELPYIAIHNLTCSLMANNRWQEAKAAFYSPLGRQNTGGLMGDFRRRWLVGLISFGLGEYDLAEKPLIRAKQGFERAGLPYRAASVSRALEKVWRYQGRDDEANELSAKTKEVFRSYGIADGAEEGDPLILSAQALAK